MLIARGVKVITDREAEIHVSGHPARDELVRVYQWVRPRIALPVHGEVLRHDGACGTGKGLPGAGDRRGAQRDLVRLAPGPAEIIDHVFPAAWPATATR